jgi:hypothetical protein
VSVPGIVRNKASSANDKSENKVTEMQRGLCSRTHSYSNKCLECAGLAATNRSNRS